MRQKSHRCLGEYLARRYLCELPEIRVRAFLFGCTQPDRNPLTYLKGSLGFHRFRGHNYPNSRRFLNRISRRLEEKYRWNLLDYYTLGKLIHYTADAFTAAHNPTFPEGLSLHLAYEEALQNCFLESLQKNPVPQITYSGSAGSCMEALHRQYRSAPAGAANDCRYILLSCCAALELLFPPVWSSP